MLAISKVLFCFILIFAMLYGGDGIKDGSALVKDKTISYPTFDISLGLGIVWLFQFNTAISPVTHFYFQPRVSIALIANEFGFTFGYQTKYREDTILRIGAGFSRGRGGSLDPGGGSNDEWKSLYLRFGILEKSKKNTIINPNINITRFGGRLIFSGNVAIGSYIFENN